MDRAIVLLSGGVDSAVALYWAKEQGWEVQPLSFDYFGRPKREHPAMERLVEKAGVRPARYVELPFLKEVDDLGPSDVTNTSLRESPEGYIPARNLVFYGLAAYYGELEGARYVVGGHNRVDPKSFPDASPKFFNFLDSLFRLSLWSYGKSPLHVIVPLSAKSKEEVLRMGIEMGVPFELTWSCYWDRDVPCGTCGSCRERRSAFEAIGARDPAPYESAEARSARRTGSKP